MVNLGVPDLDYDKAAFGMVFQGIDRISPFL